MVPRRGSARLEVVTQVSKRTPIVVVLALVAVGAFVWWGVASRAKAMVVLARETHEMAVPTLSVLRPRRAAPQEEVVLPGTIQAFSDAPIYARTSGYLEHRYVDIGAQVRNGMSAMTSARSVPRVTAAV
jgi:multidrug efflux pump subunit AcrA (membrane-fusion protein)